MTKHSLINVDNSGRTSRRRYLPVFYKLSFANKILVVALVLLMLLGIPGTIGFQLVLRSRLHDEVASSTRMLANVVAKQAAPLLVGDNVKDFISLLTQLERIDDTIAYVVVVNRAGKVVAHTFSWDPPDVVLKPPDNPSPMGEDEYRKVHFNGHTYLNISAPILSGAIGAGTLQVGIGIERIDRFIRQLNLLFFVVLAVLIMVGTVVANIIFRYATRPIVELTQLADQVSLGNLDVDFDFGVPVKCWEIKNCGRNDCAAYKNTLVQCWYVDGTPCEGYESRFPQKLMGCRTCEVYRQHKGDEIVQLYDSFRHMTYVLHTSKDEMERSDRFQRSLIRNSFDGIIATDATGTVRIFNRIAQNLTGFTEEEVAGKMAWDELFISKLSRDLQQPLFQNGSGIIFGFYRQEKILRCKDGSTVDVRASGITLREENRRVGMVFFFQDLREVKRLREELIQKERLAATGQTVASISHSIKNILDGLRGGAYIHNRGLRINDPVVSKEGWAMVEKNIDHISALVADLLNYALDRKPDLEKIDPNELVIDVAETLKSKAESQGTVLEVYPNKDVSSWMLDSYAIHQLLMNLVTNALDATAGIDGSWVRVSLHLSKIDQLEVRVQDNGPGIPPNLIDNLFVSMVSTKGSKGSGLGLLVVYKIATEHSGTVAVDTEMAPGATFRVFFPSNNGNDSELLFPANQATSY